MDSDGERNTPRTLSESSCEMVGMFLMEMGGAERAGPMGRIAHLAKLGCSLETSENESMHVRTSLRADSFSQKKVMSSA